MCFTYIILTPPPNSSTLEIYNFDRPSLTHHCCILSLSDLCQGVKKKIIKEKMHCLDTVSLAKAMNFFEDHSLVMMTTE